MEGFVLTKVTAAYEDKTVLQNFSAVFQKGQIYVVMGPSGCGKTTLLRLLLGLHLPAEGKIDGAGKLRCGTVFQEDRLCEVLSARQNVALVCRDANRVKKYLGELGLPDAEQEKPVRELSGGQRRRVALARAVLFESDFLILDEPFKGLDEENRQIAMRYVLLHRGDRGLVLVTHDPAEADFFGGTRIGLTPLEN